MSVSAKNRLPYKTHLVDPVFDVANSRAEFRFNPDTCFFADMRLLDIGAYSPGGATVANGILGAECPIRSIHLMDGGTTLDTINDYPQWRAVQKLNVKNDGAISVGRWLSKNQVGYIVSGELDTTEASYGQGQNVIVAQDQGNTIAANVGGAVKAWISLKSVFPFLANSAVLPTNVFRQLKVVVEFQSSAALGDYLANKAADAVTTRGLIVIDELEDSEAKMKAMMEYSGVRWRGIVQDRWQLDAVTAGTQTVTQKLRGFDGMWIDDMVVKLTPQTVPQTGGGNNRTFGAVGSLSVPNATMQLRVNGANKLPRSGVDGKMRALALLTDSIGSIDTMTYQVFMNPRLTVNAHDGTIRETYGMVSMFGIEVKDYVEDLQLTIGRDFKANNALTNAALNINVFGRVKKSLVLEGPAGYRIFNVTS